MVWTTAQGRFGRPLRATGIQHPAPALTCVVNRDEHKLWVSAPYAVTVFDGRNVTAEPPRTQLWCLLYAQARQADNLDSRNILLDDKQLDWRLEIEDVPDRNRFLAYDDHQRRTLKNLTVRSIKDDLSYAKAAATYKLAEATTSVDATRRGSVAWSSSEVSQLLALLGLPEDSPLSVLVVRILRTSPLTEVPFVCCPSTLS